MLAFMPAFSCKFLQHCIYLFFQEELARMGEIDNAMTIFVVATYGEGDPTDNAQEFYEWLQNDRDDLDCLHFTVSVLPANTMIMNYKKLYCVKYNYQKSRHSECCAKLNFELVRIFQFQFSSEV